MENLKHKSRVPYPKNDDVVVILLTFVYSVFVDVFLYIAHRQIIQILHVIQLSIAVLDGITLN